MDTTTAVSPNTAPRILAPTGVLALLIGMVGLSSFAGLDAQAQDLFPDKALEASVRREVFEKRYNNDPITLEDVKNISQDKSCCSR